MTKAWERVFSPGLGVLLALQEWRRDHRVPPPGVHDVLVHAPSRRVVEFLLRGVPCVLVGLGVLGITVVGHCLRPLIDWDGMCWMVLEGGEVGSVIGCHHWTARALERVGVGELIRHLSKGHVELDHVAPKIISDPVSEPFSALFLAFRGNDGAGVWSESMATKSLVKAQGRTQSGLLLSELGALVASYAGGKICQIRSGV